MLKDERAFILAATPTETVELKTIFSSAAGSIRRMFENPPALRDAGWDLRTRGESRLVGGELIRTEGRGFILDLYRDGSLLLCSRIDPNTLAWADKDGLRLHTLAMIERTVSFTRLYAAVLKDLRDIPEQVQ